MLSNYKYTDKEITELVKSMVILIDTREQNCKHITDYFDKAKIGYKVKRLGYGDYSFCIPKNPELSIDRDLYFDKEIVVERKGSLEELSGNFTKERDRIEKEFCLAPVHKVLLIEGGSYSDMLHGRYDTSYSNKSYWATLHSFWHKYNIPFVFMPDNRDSGFFIRGYFEYYLKNIIR